MEVNNEVNSLSLTHVLFIPGSVGESTLKEEMCFLPAQKYSEGINEF